MHRSDFHQQKGFLSVLYSAFGMSFLLIVAVVVLLFAMGSRQMNKSTGRIPQDISEFISQNPTIAISKTEHSVGWKTYKLGRQSWPEIGILELRQICIWVAARPPSLGAKREPLPDRLPHLLPAPDVAGGQLRGREPPQTTRHTSHQSHRAVQHRTRRTDFPSGRPPFVVAVLAKALFQFVIGARDVRIRIAMEQSRTITARDLQEMIQCRL
jgi:hypothetical protein